MRIGLVESLNARPLTWGFEKNSGIKKIYSSPRILSEMLIKGDLDSALISSVEIIRHREMLGYSASCGVCAGEYVRSILYFQNKSTPPPYQSIQVDIGSKSSVALLQLLHFMDYGRIPEVVPSSPEKIQEDIRIGVGSHLLFGDNALIATWNNDHYSVIDLAEWWFKNTNLYFIFALWAYPLKNPLRDNIFTDSLRQGLESIDEIIEIEIRKSKIPQSKKFIENYLKNDLNFIPNKKHWDGLSFFESELRLNRIL